MRLNYKPSINIIRDELTEFNYITTANSKRVFSQILNVFKQGIHTFNIIGTYGSGKSAFILAFEKTLKKEKKYFDIPQNMFNGYNFKFLNIIGKYDSITKQFSEILNLSYDTKASEIISELSNYIDTLTKNNEFIIFIIDEFGKFLEYAAKNEPEKEIYFIQQLSELINSSQYLSILITIQHQSFDSYAYSLNKLQRIEWEKVKGRLKEIPFNEPVEQLLYLASERISRNGFDRPKDKIEKATKLIKDSNLFPLKTEINLVLAEKLYPLDILTASFLTTALQYYAQNERSLFNFLDSDDYKGLYSYDSSTNPFFNLACLYDYLIFNYYAFLNTKNNPHYTQWSLIKSSLERIEGLITDNLSTASRIIKTIGLLNIFGKENYKLDINFLKKYGKICLGEEQIENTLKLLINNKIIRFVNFKNRFILFEGTDLDIEKAISEADGAIDHGFDVVEEIRKYFNYKYIPAKAISYIKGTPRFFEILLTEDPVISHGNSSIDGTINIIFSKKPLIDKIKKISDNNKKAILYIYIRNFDEILELLYEIKRILFVIEKYYYDKIAVRELRTILAHKKDQVNNTLNSIIYGNTSCYYNGKEIFVKSYSDLNALLSKICDELYFKAPIIKNELINKDKLSSSINLARKRLLKKIITDWNKKDLGFASNKYPPEKTIYLSLIKETGIHRSINNEWILSEPYNTDLQHIWKACENLIEKSKNNPIYVNDFYKVLFNQPFKLKKGFLDFWIPIFLLILREDYALYGPNGFIPRLQIETIELIIKKPKNFRIKAFNIEGLKLDLYLKYQEFIHKTSPQRKVSRTNFINTIRPFLLFYKELPEYTKHTKRLSKNAQNLRNAIANATDPEKSFFYDFPSALGYSTLELNKEKEFLFEYINKLQDAIREIRNCYDEFLNRIENHILTITGYYGLKFEDYKYKLNLRFSYIKDNLLLPHQIAFLQRINSELNERKTWLESIIQVIIKKPLTSLNDRDEEYLYDQIQYTIIELDNLCDLSKYNKISETEDLIKVEVTEPGTKMKSTIVRIPDGVKSEVEVLQLKLEKFLGNNRTVKLATLINLLKREMGSNE